MGLDQRIWASIDVNGTEKQVAIHYWRKQYEIDKWFFARLPGLHRWSINADQECTAWSVPMTAAELDLLEADQHALAFQMGFDVELIWRCRKALSDGFTLSYCRDH